MKNFPHIQFPKSTIDKDCMIYKAFADAGHIRVLKKDEILHWQDDPPTKFYIVKSGQLRSFLLSDDGRQITLEIVSEGRLFGLSSYAANLPRPCSSSALVDTELYYMDYDDLRPYMLENVDIAMELFHLLGDNIYFLVAQINNLSFYSAKKRIAYSLIHLSESFKKKSSATSYTLPFTHQELADLDGVNRVTANRILQTFEKNNWIRLKYGKIQVVNKAALQEILDSE